MLFTIAAICFVVALRLAVVVFVVAMIFLIQRDFRLDAEYKAGDQSACSLQAEQDDRDEERGQMH